MSGETYPDIIKRAVRKYPVKMEELENVLLLQFEDVNLCDRNIYIEAATYEREQSYLFMVWADEEGWVIKRIDKLWFNRYDIDLGFKSIHELRKMFDDINKEE